MKIALASQNGRSLTGHAGKCRHFFIYDSESGAAQSLHLAPGQSLHDWPGHSPHSLAGVDAVVAASVGIGVAGKLRHCGVQVLATPERDLARVVAQLVAEKLPQSDIRTHPDGRSQPGACWALLGVQGSHAALAAQKGQ